MFSLANICTVLGAAVIAFGSMYAVLRVGCWADGREW